MHYLQQREANNVTISSTSIDGTEMRFKILGGGKGDALGPFFGLAEREEQSIGNLIYHCDYERR